MTPGQLRRTRIGKTVRYACRAHGKVGATAVAARGNRLVARWLQVYRAQRTASSHPSRTSSLSVRRPSFLDESCSSPKTKRTCNSCCFRSSGARHSVERSSPPKSGSAIDARFHLVMADLWNQAEMIALKVRNPTAFAKIANKAATASVVSVGLVQQANTKVTQDGFKSKPPNTERLRGGCLPEICAGQKPDVSQFQVKILESKASQMKHCDLFSPMQNGMLLSFGGA